MEGPGICGVEIMATVARIAVGVLLSLLIASPGPAALGLAFPKYDQHESYSGSLRSNSPSL